MASKIEKTLARQKQKIAEGQFYEAHQHLRVITSRYVSSNPPNYEAAINILYKGALLLLQAVPSDKNQNIQAVTNGSDAKDASASTTTSSAGSGADLAMYLIEVYKKAETEVDAASRGRIINLLRAFPHGEPVRKRFLTEALGWSSKFGEYPTGDPEIHHVAGQLLMEDSDPYEAERHLLLGTKDSPAVLAAMEYHWYTLDNDPSTVPLYLSRCVLPYLLLRNMRAARQCHAIFTSKLPTSLQSESISPHTDAPEIRVYPALPLLNFLSLLLVAAERGTSAKGQYNSLKNRYLPYLNDQIEGLWDDQLEQIAESYFGIRKPKPMGNPLMDLMGGMFGGMGGGSSGARGPGSSSRSPPIMGVD